MTEFKAPIRYKSENNRQYAYRALYGAIMRFELEPGRQLSEPELSEALNISRTPIREAILALQDLRLVEIFPQRFSYVSRINMNYVEEGVFLRHAVETAVIHEAMKSATPTDMSALRENLSLQKMRLEEERWDDFVEADNEFHNLLYKAAGKPLACASLGSITAHLTRLRHLQNRDASTFATGFEEHLQFFDAIAGEKDMDIGGAVYRHLTAGHRKVLPHLKQEYPHYFE